SESILHTSGADLLVLQSDSGDLLAFHAASLQVPASDVKALLETTEAANDWWFVGGHLFDVSSAPIVAGAGLERRSLGRIVLGREVSPQSVVGSDSLGIGTLTFERDKTVILSSTSPATWPEFNDWLRSESSSGSSVQDVTLGGERYLASFVELAGDHPVRMYLLQSYDQATSFVRALNRMLMLVGAIAVLVVALVGFALSRQITRPLENLAQGTRLMESGNFEFPLHAQGRDEVAELTRAFEHMRSSIQASREGMLRSARLEAVGRLAGGVAHDFNNLVMIIKGYSDMLLDKAAPEARPLLDEIKRAGERAATLTRQLLAFSRKQALVPQILDPNKTVGSMVKMLRVLIGEDIELETHFADAVGSVKVDPGQLEQVIMNLAVNARDAMPGGGKLIVRTDSCQLTPDYADSHPDVTPGNYVLIAVTDSGCGMSEATLAHIFEPFFTTKEPGKGTGLGLATVYGIVSQSRGHVAVESKLGAGTTFRVYLPALDAPASAARMQQEMDAPRGSGTVLFVEDEVALRELGAEALHRLGYRVLCAGNGLEALAISDQHPGRIDVVVTDLVMPRMGGLELIEKLQRKRSSFGVIFMSGYTDAAVLKGVKLARDTILLHKPFSTELLARSISNARQAATEDALARSAAGS
ncbi:MAG TPA: ATP-binding protein, partial [Terriglobales bacterium]